MKNTFLGYTRPDDTVGVRNLIAVIPSVFCAGKVAERIANQVPGTIFFRHPVGCSQVGEDLEITARTLIEIGKNPNFAGVLVVGLGCERFSPYELAEGIAPTNKLLQTVVIQNEGDTLATIEKGIKYVKEMQQIASKQQREEVNINHLSIGLVNTDYTENTQTNLLIGNLINKLVVQGGTALIGEIKELVAVKESVIGKTVNNQVAKEVEEAFIQVETRLKKHDFNINKAIEIIKKVGKNPIQGVVNFKDSRKSKGVYLIDRIGHEGDISTAQVAAGAQLLIYPTGYGTPVGFPGIPVFKVTGNKQSYDAMKENFDSYVDAKHSYEELAEKLYQDVIDVASGKMVKAEILGHDELFCVTRLP